MAKADMFLFVEGKQTGVIKGELNSPEHPEWIEVMGWTWGMTGSTALTGGGASSRSALNELRISKLADAATVPLMSVMRNNEAVKKAVLTVRKAGANPPVDYFTITIKGGRVTSHTVGNASPGSSELTESLAFAFEEITVTYATQSTLGDKGADLEFNAQVHSD